MKQKGLRCHHQWWWFILIFFLFVFTRCDQDIKRIHIIHHVKINTVPNISVPLSFRSALERNCQAQIYETWPFMVFILHCAQGLFFRASKKIYIMLRIILKLLRLCTVSISCCSTFQEFLRYARRTFMSIVMRFIAFEIQPYFWFLNYLWVNDVYHSNVNII